MTQHSILMNSEMVRATLEGRKTMTRRPIKFDGSISNQMKKVLWPNVKGNCPFGQVGDILILKTAKDAIKIFEDVRTEITNIRVERLQDISEEDAKAEGVLPKIVLGDQVLYIPSFIDIWNSIYSKTFPWESNPWVWVIEYRRI